MKNRVFKITLLFTVLLFAAASVVQAGNDVRGTKKTSKVYKVSSTLEGGAKGDAYAMNINNIYLPYNRKGIIADVNYGDFGSLGKYPNGNGIGFLFSSGFFLSGYSNGTLFTNAVASASLVEDYLQGTVADGPRDSRAQIYVVNSNDEPFGASWQDYIKAVELGADFYDGDGDGQYTPVDKNGNGTWDPDEDMPDLIGDETGWTVYHDGLAGAQRRYSAVDPLGIEVRQSIFAFASSGAIGNIIFLRYRFKYVGLGDPNEPDALTDVLFGVWADPDMGDAVDDLVGVDVPRNAGYIYNDPTSTDAQWGAAAPTFMIDFFSGPVDYQPGVTFTDNDGDGVYTDGVDTPLDTAYSIKGQLKGITEYPGAKNLAISSFVHYQNGDPDLDDPDNEDEARFYMEGLDKVGNPPDPCDWAYGAVLGGVDCATVDNALWYSGDPVTQTGWINTVGTDQRQMQNVGPFTLNKNEEKEILVAYVVGQGTDNLSSITEARRIDDGAQFVFDKNFLSPAPPPNVSPTVETSDDFIDLIWETPKQVSYSNKTDAYDLYFEGYNVWSFRTRSTQEIVANQANQQLLQRYSLDNNIESIYKENGETGGIDLLYEEGSLLLDYDIYTDPELGKIRMRIEKDPWTGSALVKGKPYYFAITSYAINYTALVEKASGTPGLGAAGDYYLSKNAFVGEVENVARIVEVIVGVDGYNPPILPISGTQVTGNSSGKVSFDVVDKSSLTGHKYDINFVVDSAVTDDYVPYWSLTDATDNVVLADSQKDYLYGNELISFKSYDGLIVKLDKNAPSLGTMTATTTTPWYAENSTAFYVSEDIPGNLPTLPALSKSGNYLRADKIRNVEIRFGTQGKAYRYLNGYIGSAISRNTSYFYAEAVTADDTTSGRGTVGKLGEGFVDVPFTAWVKDDVYGEERQLAVGFIEKSKKLNGNADGVWDPDTSYRTTGEYIVIFNSDYDPNGNQYVYKGDSDSWANMRGYTVSASAPLSADEKKKAKSTYFDALYVVGIGKSDPAATYSNGDIFTIPVTNYPYTESTVFSVETKQGGELTATEEKELFDKVNVFPNPLFGFNPATSWTGTVNVPDEPFVTFSNLPEEISIKIYSLSGQLLRSLTIDDKDSPTSPYLRWDLLNEEGLRVASGLYLAIVSSPKYGDKILKFSIIMPQKQIQRF